MPSSKPCRHSEDDARGPRRRDAEKGYREIQGGAAKSEKMKEEQAEIWFGKVEGLGKDHRLGRGGAVGGIHAVGHVEHAHRRN